MKIGITADLHIHPWKNHPYCSPDDRMQQILLTLKNICSLKLDVLCIAGDLFHTNHVVNVIGALEANSIIENSRIESIVLLPGNHDITNNDTVTPNSTQLVQNFWGNVESNVTTIEKFWDYYDRETHYLLLFVPYIGNKEKYLALLNENIKSQKRAVKDKAEVKILISHVGISGIFPGEGSINSFSVEPEELRPDYFDLIVLGHYHKAQWIDEKTYYVGSPIPHTWGEINDEKSVMVIDTDTGEIEYVNVLQGVKTLKNVFINTTDDIEKNRQNFNSYCRVISSTPALVDIAKSVFKESEFLIEDQKIIEEGTRLQVSLKSKTEEIMNAYADYKKPENIDQVKKIGHGIISEVTKK